MNATAPNVNPAQAASLQPGRQADPAASDTPFSRLLSGEIARQGGEATPADAATEPAEDEAALQALDPAAAAAGLPTQPVANLAADAGDAPTGAPSALPDALLGLPIPPELARLASAAAEETEPAGGLGIALDARSGKAAQAGQVDGMVGRATKGRPAALPEADPKPTASAAPATPADTEFSEQLAAARQSDPARAGERVAELMSHPSMRAAVHAATAEAVPASADPSASRLTPAVGTAAWGQALGDKLVWMASGTQQTASLTLNPPNLGPLQVVLNVTNDQATASFYAVQPEVRQALESALPRLREMMGDAGIQLGQATVSADTPRQNDTPERQAQRLASDFLGRHDGNSSEPAQAMGAAGITRSGRGLVDTFA